MEGREIQTFIIMNYWLLKTNLHHFREEVCTSIHTHTVTHTSSPETLPVTTSLVCACSELDSGAKALHLLLLWHLR